MFKPTEPPNWHKSSRCASGTCVEVAKVDGQYLVRDGKNPGVVLSFTREEWTAFLDAAADGEFRL
jgi:hypothetical protein